VTGTDTAVGKTWVSLGLMAALKAQGRVVVGMKPISAGCEATPAGLRNGDATALMAQSSVPLPYELVNPVAFEQPIAPHIAAADAGTRIDLRRIERAYAKLVRSSDICVVEGAGGWLVPLGPRSNLADLAARLELPVIVVVGIRLGCLNHALLTVESIARRGLPLAGWVANVLVDASARPDANVAALEARIRAPLLARVAYTTRPKLAHFCAAFQAPQARDLLRSLGTTSDAADPAP
jgi:dethiobiotin synthetase